MEEMRTETNQIGICLTIEEGMDRQDMINTLAERSKLGCGSSISKAVPGFFDYSKIPLEDVPCPCCDPNH